MWTRFEGGFVNDIEMGCKVVNVNMGPYVQSWGSSAINVLEIQRKQSSRLGLTLADHTGLSPVQTRLNLLGNLLRMFPTQPLVVDTTCTFSPDRTGENEVALTPSLFVCFVDCDIDLSVES